MKKLFLTMTAVAALAALTTLASADPDAAGNAAAGAAVGAGAGFAVGGPVGAAVGAGVGGTVGRERSCTRDSAGNSVCEEIRH